MLVSLSFVGVEGLAILLAEFLHEYINQSSYGLIVTLPLIISVDTINTLRVFGNNFLHKHFYIHTVIFFIFLAIKGNPRKKCMHTSFAKKVT